MGSRRANFPLERIICSLVAVVFLAAGRIPDVRDDERLAGCANDASISVMQTGSKRKKRETSAYVSVNARRPYQIFINGPPSSESADATDRKKQYDVFC